VHLHAKIAGTVGKIRPPQRRGLVIALTTFTTTGSEPGESLEDAGT
jgi:hypothetical protein